MYNPGNMRAPDGNFQTFDTPEAGLSAMQQDLITKVSGKSDAMKANYGDNYEPTLRNVISTWAPPTENNTRNYVDFVASKSGLDPDQPLTTEDVSKFMPHMITMEKGAKEARQYVDAGNIATDAQVDAPKQDRIGLMLEAEKRGILPADKQGLLDEARKRNLIPALVAEDKVPSPPKISTGEDVAKSLAGGVERGAAAIPMALPNLLNQAVAGPQLLGRGIAEGADKLLGIESQPRGDLWQPFYSSEDALHMLPEKLQPHDAQTGAGVAADLIGQIAGGTMAGKALSPGKDPIATADDVAMASHKAYAEADAKGGILNPSRTDLFIDEAEKLLPQTAKGKALSTGSPLVQAVDKIKNFRGQSTTLREAQEIDEHIGDLIDSEYRLGGLSKEGKKLIDLQDAFRDMVKNTKDTDISGGKGGFEAWKQGQKLWSDKMKMQDIERIVNRASMMENPVTGLKTGFRTLAGNKARMRGFSPAERKLIENAAKTGGITEIAKTWGSRLIPIGALVSGGGFGHALAAQAASTASRAGASKLQLNRADKVLESIARSSGVQQPNVQPSFNIKAKPRTAAIFGGVGSEMDNNQEYKKGGHINLTAQFLARAKK